MVELNGGKIDVKSSLGKGTTFIVRFPKLAEDEASENSLQGSQTGTSPTQKNNKHTEYVG